MIFENWLVRYKFPLFNLLIKFIDLGPIFSCLIRIEIEKNFIFKVEFSNFVAN